MNQTLVEHRDTGFYLVGSRVPIDRIVRKYRDSTLSLEQVNGAIAYYLGHKDEAQQAMTERKRVEDEFSKTHQVLASLRENLDRARQQQPARS